MLKAKQLRRVVAVRWLLAFVNMYAFYILRIRSHWIVPMILFTCCLMSSFLNKYCIIETKNKSTLEIIRNVDALKCIR